MLDHIELACASIRLVHQSQIFLLLLKLQPLTDNEYVEYKTVKNLYTLNALGVDFEMQSSRKFAEALVINEISEAKFSAFNELNVSTICLQANLIDMLSKFMDLNTNSIETVHKAVSHLRMAIAGMSRDTLDTTCGGLDNAFKLVAENLINAKNCIDNEGFDHILKDQALSQDYKEQLAVALKIACNNNAQP